jgi:hypothetical protein
MRHHLSPLFLLSVLSLPVAGCSGSAEPTASSAAVASVSGPQAIRSNGNARAKSAAAPQPARTVDIDRDGSLREKSPSDAIEYFVWTREGEERTVTYRIDAAGQSCETIDGIVIATAAGTWQWQVEDQPVSTVACEHFDEEGHAFVGAPVEPGIATRASLVHVASGVEQVVVDVGIDLMGNADVKHDVGIIASIGPYVFIEESTYVYSCGAHGNTGVSTLIWNAATGTAIATPMDLGSLELARTTAIGDLTDEDDDMFAPTEENLELTELVPRFAPDGSLALGLQFTAPTCYACSRGGWSSYTKSTIVDTPAMPSVLAPFATPPPAVRAFLRAHPDVVVKGWSAR